MIPLIDRPNLASNSKVTALYTQFKLLLNALEKRNLPSDVVQFINREVELLNSMKDDAKSLAKSTKDSQSKIVKLVGKQLKIVPKNYYRKLWLVLGMSSFGIPLGVVFGMSIGNIALLGTGIPIGMGIGVLIGTKLDNKAYKEGRQLNIELKH